MNDTVEKNSTIPQIVTCRDDIVAVLERHKWPHGIKKQVTDAVTIVGTKLIDKNLYLGVIGEFSSGKSTLINAFIDEPLLSSDILQATTSSSTVIQYSQKIDIEATFSDGSSKIFTRDGLSWLDDIKERVTDTVLDIVSGQKSKTENKQQKQLRTFLNEVTANEDVAKNISNVILKHPSPILQKGIVLVDTPGTNSNNVRHTLVAKDAIENICDVTMVVIPSNIPLSADLVKFLKITISKAAHRCVFVCNKSDLLQAKERLRMESFLAERISAEFGVKSPRIFMLSALKALEPESSDSENYSALLETAREQIIALMHQQREIIQLEKIGNILVTMIAPLKDELQERLSDYNKEHKALIENMIEDVDVAWTQKASSISKSFREKSNSEKQSTISEVRALFGDAKQEMLNRINGASNIEGLKSITNRLGEVSGATQKNIDRVLRNVAKLIETDAMQRINVYAEDFEKAYIRLSTLGGTIKVDSKQFETVMSSLGSLEVDMTGGIVSIAGDAGDVEDVAMGGGMVGGAVIGQILIPIPVLGAIIGGFIGTILGSFFSPDLSEVKGKCRAEVSSKLKKCEADVVASIDNMLSNIRDKSIQKMHETSTETFEAYNALAKKMQARDKQRRHEIEALQKTINDDLLILSGHQAKVSKLLSELKVQ